MRFLWGKLEVKFLDKTARNKLYPKQEPYGLKMQEGADLTELKRSKMQRHVQSSQCDEDSNAG